MKKIIKTKFQKENEELKLKLQEEQIINTDLKNEIDELKLKILNLESKLQIEKIDKYNVSTMCNFDAECCDCLLQEYLSNFSCDKCKNKNNVIEEYKEKFKETLKTTTVVKEHINVLNTSLQEKINECNIYKKKEKILQTQLDEVIFENNFIKKEKNIPHTSNASTQTLLNMNFMYKILPKT